MNKRHYEHTLPNIRGSLSNTYVHPMGKVYAGDHQTFLFIGSRFQSCSLIALLVISRVLFVRDSTNK